MKFRFFLFSNIFSNHSNQILSSIFRRKPSKVPRNTKCIPFSFFSNSSLYSTRKEHFQHFSRAREKKKKEKASFAKILLPFSLRISFLICRRFIVSIENGFFSWLGGNSRREKWNDLRVLKASLRPWLQGDSSLEFPPGDIKEEDKCEPGWINGIMPGSLCNARRGCFRVDWLLEIKKFGVTIYREV